MTAINSFIIGFSEECSFPEAIENLQKEGVINISEWVVTNNKGTIDLGDFYHGKTFADRPITNYVSEEIYREIYKYIFEFCYIFPRNDISHAHINKIHDSIYDSINEFNKFIYLIYDIFISKKIELVIFQEIPHDGAEIVLYRLAKVMNIKTIVMANFTHFWGRIFAFRSLDDFGDFAEIPQLSDASSAVVDYDDFKKKMYYMKYQSNHDNKRANLDKIVSKLGIKLVLRSIFSVLIPKEKYQKTALAFSIANIQLVRVMNFIKNYSSLVNTNPDLSKKFVYFALHLDPEIPTTPGLAGIYSDQALAIENLRKILPKDVLIYVKENPKQTDIVRPSSFFDRLKKLKNVQLVNCNTYDLINSSIFVATIAGTAGWEAITAGKGVIVFGRTWYQTCPGVFRFDEQLNLSDVINHKTDRKTLDISVRKILQKSHPGLVYFPFADSNFKTDIKEIYPEYDRNQNIAHLASAIKALI